jgi:hypothetical protein
MPSRQLAPGSYLNRKLPLALVLISLSSCATGSSPVDPVTGMTRAERNLCEATRSFEPYRPGQCGRVEEVTRLMTRQRSGRIAASWRSSARFLICSSAPRLSANCTQSGPLKLSCTG